MGVRACGRLLLTGFVVLAASCSPAPEPPARAAVAVSVPPASSSAMSVALVPEDPSGKSASLDCFDWSPITALADDLAAVVRAALRGTSLPSSLPTEPIDPSMIVRFRGEHRPDVDTLRFVAFGIDVEIAFAPVSAQGGSEAPGLEGVVLLSERGIHVAMLRRDVVRRAEPLPPWMAGTPQVVGGVLTAARDGRLGGMLVDEELQPLFGDYWEKVQRELPTAAEVRDLETFIAAAGQPQAYDVDDLILLGRDAGGGLYSFSLNLDEHDGQVVLDARPLVRVRRVGTLRSE